MMRRAIVIGFVLAILVGLPASAGVENNPNAGTIDPVCENGLDLAAVITVGNAGHSTSYQLVGVAKSLWVLSGPGGAPVVPIIEAKGQGLDDLTVFCWWFEAEAGAFVGGDILVHPSLR